MGLFSLGGSTLPMSSGVMGSLFSPTPASTAPRTTIPTTTFGGGGGFTMGSGGGGGIVAGPVTRIPSRTTTAAPAAPAPAPAGGGSTPSYQPSYSGGASAIGAGGGGGGGGGFNYTVNNAAPMLSQSPSIDFAGLFSGMSSLMSQDQQGDVPDNIPLTTQKDTMALQGLRESSAGWGENIAGPGPNPSLGQRIPPDETKKLAALQTARIY